MVNNCTGDVLSEKAKSWSTSVGGAVSESPDLRPELELRSEIQLNLHYTCESWHNEDLRQLSAPHTVI